MSEEINDVNVETEETETVDVSETNLETSEDATEQASVETGEVAVPAEEPIEEPSEEIAETASEADETVEPVEETAETANETDWTNSEEDEAVEPVEESANEANEEPVVKEDIEQESAEVADDRPTEKAECWGEVAPEEDCVQPETEPAEQSPAQDDDDDDDDEEEQGKGRKKKKRRTYAQRRKRKLTALIATGTVFAVLAVFIIGVVIANPLTVKALIAQANKYTAVEYTEHEQLHPEKIAIDGDTDGGKWTFTADRDLKVLQFTDVHIGGGSFSKQKDMWAMNAVATMIRKEQPDLVVVTGDIAYPVPFQAGTFNNLAATQIFATMMEKLGVYWTFAFGNHDTEAYSMKTRADICDWYESQNFKYCLFDRGYADDPSRKLKEDDLGYGNNVIRVRNTAGVYTQAIVTLDSHSYIDGDYFGMAWKYDNIHQSQVDWYVGEMQKLVASNSQKGVEGVVKNLAFFHIPLVEYREAWGKIIETNKYRKPTDSEKKNGRYDSIVNPEGVEYIYGIMGENGESQKNGQKTYGVFSGLNQDNFFEMGADNGLVGTFCGHDHYNNFSLVYTKDGKSVRLTYGMSVDYLAYPGIYKEHLQRGCTVITVSTDGDFDCVQKNYYEDYDVAHEKN